MWVCWRHFTLYAPFHHVCLIGRHSLHAEGRKKPEAPFAKCLRYKQTPDHAENMAHIPNKSRPESWMGNCGQGWAHRVRVILKG